MHDYKIATLPFTSERMQEAPKPKTKKFLSPEEKKLVIEALEAGGSRKAIAERFDMSPQTIGNIDRDRRHKKADEKYWARQAIPEIPAEPAQKRITQSVTEVYDAIEHLHEEDKLRVLLAVAYLFGMSTNLQ